MRRRISALFCALCLMVCTACALYAGTAETPGEGAYKIYYGASEASAGGGALGCEYWTPEEESVSPERLLARALEAPEGEGLVFPYPAGVRLRGLDLDGGVLSLNLSEAYGELSGVALTVANYCLTLTLCQAEGVEALHITVEGKELPYAAAISLRPEDVVLTGDEEKPVYLDAVLWFGRREGEGLEVEVRRVRKDEDATAAQAVLEALLAGPEDGERLCSLLPEEARLNSVQVKDGVCTADFTAALAGGIGEGGEARLAVYALVNTLAASLENVDAVQILIDGAPVSSLGGMAVYSPVTPDFSLEFGGET